MIQIKKKTLLVIILFLFLLCGCNNKDDLLIGVSRINESVVCEEYCTMDLKIIASEELENITLENINASVNYDYKIKESNKEVRLAEKEEKKIYSYDLSIQLFDPVEVNNIELNIDDEKYSFNIGTFTCLERSKKTKEHLDCNVVKNGNLLEGMTHHVVKIVNKSDEPVIISTVKLKDQTNQDILVCQTFKDNLILSNKSKEMANCYLDINNSLYSLNYLLEVSYIYKGKVYETFFEVKDSSKLESVSNLESVLVVDQSCFVLSE